MQKKVLLIIVSCLLPFCMNGQDTKSSYKGSKEAVKELSKSLEEGKSDEELAVDYMRLAKELIDRNEYARSENYLNQAISLYTRLKDTEQLSVAYRELAKVQEAQDEFDKAIVSFTNAARYTNRKEWTEMNLNDADRLKSRNDPMKQSGYIQRNIALSEKTDNKKDAALSYQQMAEVKNQLDDREGAIEEYESALSNSGSIEEKMVIRKKIAETYIEDEQYEKAIDVTEKWVEEARTAQIPSVEIGALLDLAKTYFEANRTEQCINTLHAAYDLAITHGETMMARQAVRMIIEYYTHTRNTRAALAIYNDFVGRLDTLILQDTTLIEGKFFQLYEERITRLEKERELKDELIRRTNRFNYALLGFIVVIFIFILFMVRSLYAINKKNKRIALQSLRREMNPHFLFNSLNSVNQFIAQNKELEANKFLSSYSKLMRTNMENSNKDFISLSLELDQLRQYLELEHLRFQDKFSFHINIEDAVDTDATYIPNMLLQPQLENAIWHGLRYHEGKGELLLSIHSINGGIKVIIEDNGIGLTKSQELKTSHQKRHNSRGMMNTTERIELLNQLYNIHITLDIQEKTGDSSGVIVTLIFPLLDRKKIIDEYTIQNKERHC